MLAHSKQHPSGSSFAAVQIHPLASLAVSVASLLTAFRPFGAPSPLFAPPLVLRLHPASKRGRSTSLPKGARFAGVLLAMGSPEGGGKGEELSYSAENNRNSEYTLVSWCYRPLQKNPKVLLITSKAISLGSTRRFDGGAEEKGWTEGESGASSSGDSLVSRCGSAERGDCDHARESHSLIVGYVAEPSAQDAIWPPLSICFPCGMDK